MTTLAAIWRAVFGLFVDDEFLAVAIIAVVIVAAFLAFALHSPSYLVGGELLAGCVVVLVASAYLGAARRR